MSHDLNPEELFAYYDGELPAPRRAVVQAHMKECVACRGQLQAWRDESTRLLAPLKVQASETFVQNVMRKVRACAPSFATPRWGLFMRWAYPALAFSISLCGIAFHYSLQPTSFSVENALLGVSPAATSAWASSTDDPFFDTGGTRQ